MRVVDASAWVEWLLQTPLGIEVDQVLSNRNCVIDMTSAEVLSALSKVQLQHSPLASRVGIAALAAMNLPARTYSHSLLLSRAWELRRNLSIYDGLYVALAETLDCELITCDARLARGAKIASQVSVLLV